MRPTSILAAQGAKKGKASPNKKQGESHSYQVRKVLCATIPHSMSQMYRMDSFAFSTQNSILCMYLCPRRFPVTFSLFSIQNVRETTRTELLIRGGLFILHSPKNWLLLIIQMKIRQKLQGQTCSILFGIKEVEMFTLLITYSPDIQNDKIPTKQVICNTLTSYISQVTRSPKIVCSEIIELLFIKNCISLTFNSPRIYGTVVSPCDLALFLFLKMYFKTVYIHLL